MSKPKIDPEVIANARSAPSIVNFTKYIADYEKSLNSCRGNDYCYCYSSRFCPLLFDANPFTELMAVLLTQGVKRYAGRIVRINVK